ncbi:MAG: sigma-70 family RNA polymerase sigma factor [Lewinellaceae bacterium]|nr:sigma-70 family RNA polymerase sigma factor [Lewinellaceae bacterium]
MFMYPIPKHIIEGCKNQNPGSQKELYELSKGYLFGLCMRYIPSSADAEDVFSDGFFKIFTKIDSYSSEGSFEGWMRRIMINECLMHLRKKTSLHLTVELTENQNNLSEESEEFETQHSIDEIMTAIDQLPDGYRTIFNLFVIEEFKHREIAEALGISINTSKSQLILAKKKLQSILKKKVGFNLKINKR